MLMDAWFESCRRPPKETPGLFAGRPMPPFVGPPLKRYGVRLALRSLPPYPQRYPEGAQWRSKGLRRKERQGAYHSTRGDYGKRSQSGCRQVIIRGEINLSHESTMPALISSAARLSRFSVRLSSSSSIAAICLRRSATGTPPTGQSCAKSSATEKRSAISSPKYQ